MHEHDARTSRMKIGTAERPIAIIALVSDGPRMAANAIARIRKGQASIASVTREIAMSIQPPYQPASRPKGMPIASAIRTETMPASSEVCAP
jgi:hypothetical protein